MAHILLKWAKFGKSCTAGELIFTRVSYYIDWIKETILSNEQKPQKIKETQDFLIIIIVIIVFVVIISLALLLFALIYVFERTGNTIFDYFSHWQKIFIFQYDSNEEKIYKKCFIFIKSFIESMKRWSDVCSHH